MTPALTAHVVQLDETHSLEWMFAHEFSWYEPYGNEIRVGGRMVVGAITRHFGSGNEPCEGTIHFTRPRRPSPNEAVRPIWVVHSIDPLTLFPSLLCTKCQDHGWIKEGTWLRHER